MPNDDLYLNDGETYTNGVYYPETPEDQKEEEVKAKGVIASSYPVMDNVADWFTNAIKECDSIDNIEMTEMTVKDIKYSRAVSIEGQIFAYQLLKELLSDKAAEFAEFGEGRS